MTEGVLVVTEQHHGVLRKISIEAACAGKRLAEKLGEPLEALVVGTPGQAAAQQLGQYGVCAVLCAADAVLAEYAPCEYAQVVAAVVAQRRPRIVLFGAAGQGRELSARVAAGPVGRAGHGLHPARHPRRPSGGHPGALRRQGDRHGRDRRHAPDGRYSAQRHGDRPLRRPNAGSRRSRSR